MITVGTRQSQLALIQTDIVVEKLREYYLNNPDEFYQLSDRKEYVDLEPKFEVVPMTTTGDIVLDKPLAKIGTKSLFTKELEVALLNGKVDFVVHSLKDLPTTLPDGCIIGAIMQRDNPEDVIVLKNSLVPDYNPLELFQATINEGQTKHKIGTSSLRRISMMKRITKNIDLSDIRGNLNTRLKKLDEDDYTAIVLAKAGLDRMNWSARVSAVLSPDTHPIFEDWCYAVGQGAIAIECRANDQSTLDILKPIVDLKTTYETVAERSLMKRLEGGCSVPLGVRSSWSKDQKVLRLEGIVLSADGDNVVKADGEIDVMADKTPVEPTSSVCTPLESLTTGVKISRAFEHSTIIEENLKVCAKLGIEVANKMIEQGCLELMKQSLQ